LDWAWRLARYALTARLLTFAARHFVPGALPFSVRQGIASLHRPNNRTLLLLLSLGLGTFLMVSLYLVQKNLLTELISSSGKNQPNAVLFDIQPSQETALTNLIHSLKLPVLDEMPIITMRISSVNGRSVETLSGGGKGRDRHGWAFRREYRSTWSDHLRDGETIVAGKFFPTVTNDAGFIPVSLEQGIAKELGVGLGDEIIFDVQGVPVKTRVASLRTVEWRRIQPNFFVVFPRGSLDDAPAMHVLVTRVASSEESARMQREVVTAFPNISIIDLTLVLQTVDSILGKISFVVRFMAMFTVLTGLLVLVSALVTGRYQRVRESVLLRTLGASRGQILKILVVEYFALGFPGGAHRNSPGHLRGLGAGRAGVQSFLYRRGASVVDRPAGGASHHGHHRPAHQPRHIEPPAAGHLARGRVSLHGNGFRGPEPCRRKLTQSSRRPQSKGKGHISRPSWFRSLVSCF